MIAQEDEMQRECENLGAGSARVNGRRIFSESFAGVVSLQGGHRGPQIC